MLISKRVKLYSGTKKQRCKISIYKYISVQEEDKMSVVNELIKVESDNTLSFGNYELDVKSKKSDFEFGGDIYKVKTFNEITKLEKNGMFVYESVPGTAVNNFKMTESVVSFSVEGKEDTQITLGLEEDTEYVTYIDGINAGSVKTNLSGKLTLSVPASNGKTDIKIVKE